MQLEKLNNQPLKQNNLSTEIEDEAREIYDVSLENKFCKFYNEIQIRLHSKS